MVALALQKSRRAVILRQRSRRFFWESAPTAVVVVVVFLALTKIDHDFVQAFQVHHHPARKQAQALCLALQRLRPVFGAGPVVTRSHDHPTLVMLAAVKGSSGKNRKKKSGKKSGSITKGGSATKPSHRSTDVDATDNSNKSVSSSSLLSSSEKDLAASAPVASSIAYDVVPSTAATTANPEMVPGITTTTTSTEPTVTAAAAAVGVNVLNEEETGEENKSVEAGASPGDTAVAPSINLPPIISPAAKDVDDDIIEPEPTHLSSPESAPETAAAAPAPPVMMDLQSRRRTESVILEIQDVRTVVGSSTAAVSSVSSVSSASSSSPLGPNSSNKTNSRSKNDFAQRVQTAAAASSNTDDSLDRMLKDSYEMQQLERRGSSSPMSSFRTSSSSSSSIDKDDDGSSFSIRNIVSMTVTIDFFVVLLFLLWFLAGVFSSVVLQDDGIQIAFNQNFERLVQPALGILMIAAISDAVLGKLQEGDSDNMKDS